MQAENPAVPDASVFYRIGSQVHDHEARIRLLERESMMLSESVKQIRENLSAITATIESINKHSSKIDQIHDELHIHVEQENKDRAKLISMSVGQFLAVTVGIVLVILGK